MKKNLDELIYEETALRLSTMESKEYIFPNKATKSDFIIIALAITISIILIALCMLGVIV